MRLHPCPTCRQSVAWEGNPHRPFCSERCRLRDLGAWSSEAYRIPAKPDEEQGESWGDEAGEA